MGLETGTFLDDLIITNPIGAADFVSVGDDHLRLVKKALKNSFPGQTFPIGLVTDTGAADVYAGAMSPAPASLINGTIVMFRAVNLNTGASTFNLNALGAQSITKYGAEALIAGDIEANQFVMLQYDSASTDWEMLSLPGNAPIFNVVEDTTPQLGGNLDGQGNDITKLGTLSMTEQAEANADVAGDGQFWVDTATPNVAMFTDDAGTDHVVQNRIKTGQYTGDGATSQGITGIGFQPIMVIIISNVADGTKANVFWTTDGLVDNDAQGLAHIIGSGSADDNNMLDNRIISLDSDGFSVDDDGSDFDPNKNAQTYEYVAWG